MSSWSNARLTNVEYSATTGCNPPMASPAAEVTACCSAIPTSNTRSGNRAANLARPVGCSMAAVTQTTSARSAPIAVISSANTEVQVGRPGHLGWPVLGSMTPTVCR
jgi:hypothetical protein